MILSLMMLVLVAIEQVEGPVPTPAKEVARLLKQLDANVASEREAAEKQLLAMGAKILPLLRKEAAIANLPDEVTVRLTRVRNALEKQGAEGSAKSSRITPHGKAMKLKDALAAFTKQTGNKFIDLRVNMGQDTTNS